jgi:hypothetical protein
VDEWFLENYFEVHSLMRSRISSPVQSPVGDESACFTAMSNADRRRGSSSSHSLKVTESSSLITRLPATQKLKTIAEAPSRQAYQQTDYAARQFARVPPLLVNKNEPGMLLARYKKLRVQAGEVSHITGH